MKYLKGDEIRFPSTPSEWIGAPSYKKATQLLVSYGGGMGGANMRIYVERVHDFLDNKLQNFKLLDGKIINVNTAFIVKAEDYTVVSAKYYNTNWEQYGTVEYLVEDGTTVYLIDEYDGKVR